jgi:hypothetical protein
MTHSKTASNATHGAPAAKKEPATGGAPPSKSDHISLKAKLMAELVTERKRILWPMRIKVLLKQAWSRDIQCRPSMAKIYETLTQELSGFLSCN